MKIKMLFHRRPLEFLRSRPAASVWSLRNGGGGMDIVFLSALNVIVMIVN